MGKSVILTHATCDKGWWIWFVNNSLMSDGFYLVFCNKLYFIKKKKVPERWLISFLVQQWGFFLASNQIKLIYIVQLQVPSVRVVFTAL